MINKLHAAPLSPAATHKPLLPAIVFACSLVTRARACVFHLNPFLPSLSFCLQDQLSLLIILPVDFITLSPTNPWRHGKTMLLLLPVVDDEGMEPLWLFLRPSSRMTHRIANFSKILVAILPEFCHFFRHLTGSVNNESIVLNSNGS